MLFFIILNVNCAVCFNMNWLPHICSFRKKSTCSERQFMKLRHIFMHMWKITGGEKNHLASWSCSRGQISLAGWRIFKMLYLHAKTVILFLILTNGEISSHLYAGYATRLMLVVFTCHIMFGNSHLKLP